MVISVKIPEGTERILAEQAARRGQSVESYAAELIRKGVIGSRTFAEILAPFREQVASSEISDSELEGLFETARNEVYDAKQGNK
jgi:plasmid stability protein